MSKNPTTVLVDIVTEGVVACELVERYPDGDCSVKYRGMEYVAPEVDPEDDEQDDDNGPDEE